MVPDGNRLSLYAIPADPCTGYVSLAHVRPARPAAAPACTARVSGPAHAHSTGLGGRRPGVLRRMRHAGLAGRRSAERSDLSEPDSMYQDGQHHDFPPQDDVQSANFVTQADGQLYLLAFEGQQVENGPNSEVQLWRVVFGAASGAGSRMRWLPDGRECTAFLCSCVRHRGRARQLSEHARGPHQRCDVPLRRRRLHRAQPGSQARAFFIYGTEHYLQKTPRAARFNEF